MKKSTVAPLLIFRISDNLNITLPTFSNMSGFLTQWNQWLDAETENTDIDEKTVQVQAIEEFLSALAQLPDDHSVLTTQIDVQCPDELTHEHLCASRNLMSSLEELKFFRLIQQKLAKTENAAAKRAGLAATSPEVLTPEGNGTQASLARKGLNATVSINCERCESPMSLEPAHFVTMLLLAWPYKTANSKSNGQLLNNMVQRQVPQSSQVLNNEITQLQNQFSSVLGYMRCHSCQCKVELGK